MKKDRSIDKEKILSKIDELNNYLKELEKYRLFVARKNVLKEEIEIRIRGIKKGRK